MDKNLLCDYREKIKLHITDELSVESVNKFINFMNWSFRVRNNFLIDNFNTSNLKVVLSAYNKIKSNILSTDVNVFVFDNLTMRESKIIKYIFFNLYKKFETIKDGIVLDTENEKIIFTFTELKTLYKSVVS